MDSRERFLRAVRAYHSEHVSEAGPLLDEVMRLYDERPAAAGGGEAVAWLYEHAGLGRNVQLTRHDESKGWTISPLYRAPPPPAAPVCNRQRIECAWPTCGEDCRFREKPAAQSEREAYLLNLCRARGSQMTNKEILAEADQVFSNPEPPR